MGGSRRVELAPDHPRFDTGDLVYRVDVDAFHAAEVKHHAAVAGAVARDVMAAPTYRQSHLCLARDIDRRCHVRGIDASRDRARKTVDAGVPHPTRSVVFGIRRADHRPAKARAERRDSLLGQRRVVVYGHLPTRVDYPRGAVDRHRAAATWRRYAPFGRPGDVARTGLGCG